MVITRDMRRQAAETASEAQLYLYGSEEAAEQLGRILDEASVTDIATRNQIIEQVANISLGFYPLNQIEQVLESIVSHDISETLTQELLVFFAPLDNDTNIIETEMAEIEANIQQLAQVRTMPRDMNVVQSGEDPIYRSEQDTLLAEQDEIERALASMNVARTSPSLGQNTTQPTTASASAEVPPIPKAQPVARNETPATLTQPTPIPIKHPDSTTPRWESDTE